MVAKETLSALGYTEVELSITLVNDQKISKLNQQYLSRNYPTDVLAFSMKEGEFGEVNPYFLGDVVISVETAKRQAENAGCSFEEEISLLIIHGVLHLLGYDHENPGIRAREMRKKEKELLSVIRTKVLNSSFY
ncbi:MAG: rRNA maturation RNase YbeY [Desulfobacterota bacterium]|nr:rRNA maturation RNase YbeY [Thermodesulfobacteriota bacterium]